MASGVGYHITQFTGVAANVTIELPFTPRIVRFAAPSGGAIEHGYKTDKMTGSAYLSTSTGTDAGVTIGAQQVVVANGADVNVAGATVEVEAWA